jgi:hypothetical protein
MDSQFFDEHTYSFRKNGKRYIWKVKKLWELSQGLLPFSYQITSFDKFDEDIWFCGYREPTINSVLNHIERIRKANLEFPIILSEEGLVMDGVHRILRARLEGLESIHAVQFVENPEPDSVE